MQLSQASWFLTMLKSASAHVRRLRHAYESPRKAQNQRLTRLRMFRSP